MIRIFRLKVTPSLSVAPPSLVHKRQQRAKAEVATAQRRGMPLRVMSARLWGSVRAEPTSADDSTIGIIRPKFRGPPQLLSLVAASSETSSEEWKEEETEDKDAGLSDEEEGRHQSTRSKSRLKSISDCRDRSRSAWLHFPHVELVFLLFAFEGAVGAQASALRNIDCPATFFMAAVALVIN